MTYPIAILAFNRPHYLREVLISLAGQQGVDIAGRRVFVFQDGRVNPFSGNTYYEPEIEAANAALLAKTIPTATLMPSPTNLGIALNFDRVERFLFEELAADAAIILEDDLVLGPHYIRMLDQMIGFALADPRIGYVTAQGWHRGTLEQQAASKSTFMAMSHNWAFGLTKRQWLRQMPYVEQFLSIVRDVDYMERDHDRIIDLFHSWGLGVPGTSQDVAKSHACILTDTAKVSTFACFGKYIGRIGHHFNDAIYDSRGFGDTVLFPDYVSLTAPRSEHVTKWIEVARTAAMEENVRRRAIVTDG